MFSHENSSKFFAKTIKFTCNLVVIPIRILGDYLTLSPIHAYKMVLTIFPRKKHLDYYILRYVKFLLVNKIFLKESQIL